MPKTSGGSSSEELAVLFSPLEVGHATWDFRYPVFLGIIPWMTGCRSTRQITMPSEKFVAAGTVSNAEQVTCSPCSARLS